jgi:hypothetical protein
LEYPIVMRSVQFLFLVENLYQANAALKYQLALKSSHARANLQLMYIRVIIQRQVAEKIK